MNNCLVCLGQLGRTFSNLGQFIEMQLNIFFHSVHFTLSETRVPTIGTRKPAAAKKKGVSLWRVH